MHIEDRPEWGYFAQVLAMEDARLKTIVQRKPSF